MVHALERQRPPAIALEVTPGPIRGATRSLAIALEARDPQGQYRDLLHPAVQVRAGAGAPRDVATRQVGPGRYEATVVADATETLSVSTKPEVTDGGSAAADAMTRTIVPDPVAEYRFGAPDEALLKAIASATGGAWRPTSASLVNASGDQRTARRPMWPGLVAAALALWFLDLLLRRIRVFE